MKLCKVHFSVTCSFEVLFFANFLFYPCDSPSWLSVMLQARSALWCTLCMSDLCQRCVWSLLTYCVFVCGHAAVVRCSTSASRLLLSSSGGPWSCTSPAGYSAPSWSFSLQRRLTGNDFLFTTTPCSDRKLS